MNLIILKTVELKVYLHNSFSIRIAYFIPEMTKDNIEPRVTDMIGRRVCRRDIALVCHRGVGMGNRLKLVESIVVAWWSNWRCKAKVN